MTTWRLGFLVVVLLTGACASKMSPHMTRVEIQRMSYAASGTTTKPATSHVPLSLTATDGTGLRLVSLNAEAVIEGPAAMTKLHMVFENPRNQIIEGRFSITLPSGASVSKLSMKIDGRWEKARFVERKRARNAYEDTLQRNRDPVLLEHDTANRFRARVFPIPARGRKEIVLAYTHTLASSTEPYRLRLNGIAKIDHLRVRALARTKNASHGKNYRSVGMQRSNYSPSEDFQVDQPKGVDGLRDGKFVMARFRASDVRAAGRIDSLLVLVDTSASQVHSLAKIGKKLGELMAEIGRTGDGKTPVIVAAFDQSVAPIFRGTAASFSSKHVKALHDRGALGASNLERALRWAAKHKRFRHLVVITDGVATAGKTTIGALRSAIHRYAGNKSRLDVVRTGSVTNAHVLSALTSALDVPGTVTDAKLPASRWLERLNGRVLKDLRVTVPGAKEVWPRRLTGVAPGDEVIVLAEFSDPHPAGSPLLMQLSGDVNRSLSVPLLNAQPGVIERAVATAHIRSHERMLSGSSVNKSARAEMVRHVITLSLKHRVLSKYTALIAMESEADYRRAGIDGSSGLAPGKKGKRTLNMKYLRNIPVPGRVFTSVLGKAPGRGARGASFSGSTSLENTYVVDGVTTTGLSYGSVGATRHVRCPSGSRRFIKRLGRSVEVLCRTTSGMLVPPTSPVVETTTANKHYRVPHTGRYAKVMELIKRNDLNGAVVQALRYRNHEPANVVAILALGYALQRRGMVTLAARTYGSIVDLFPGRADYRRVAGERLDALGKHGRELAIDTYRKAVALRPDRIVGYRQLAYALVRAGKLAEALRILGKGIDTRQRVRRPGVVNVLRRDMGIVGMALLARQPRRIRWISKLLQRHGATLTTTPSIAFVLTWNNDANDVDLHIKDERGGHAYYGQRKLGSGGELLADVTNGFGPEIFSVTNPRAHHYKLSVHYYNRGPMGYGLGSVETIRHDGHGKLSFEHRPFVIMNNDAMIQLGSTRTY